MFNSHVFHFYNVTIVNVYIITLKAYKREEDLMLTIFHNLTTESSTHFLTKWTLRYVHNMNIFVWNEHKSKYNEKLCPLWSLYRVVATEEIYSSITLNLWYTPAVVAGPFTAKVLYSVHTFHKHQYSNTWPLKTHMVQVFMTGYFSSPEY